uniref:Uncharacterized protein n=1 Tax=Anguilla anguilla TaxID=7936 RepID=A0A0E9VDE0_ANGAN
MANYLLVNVFKIQKQMSQFSN